jgi:ATP-dependent protease ClpP protease subunit
MDARYFGKATTHAVTATPASIAVAGAPDSRHVFIVSSDVVIHLDRTATADPASSLRIPADTLVKFATFAGDVVSFVKGDGTDDGTIWFTETDS